MKNWEHIHLNPQLLKTFTVRAQVIDAIRTFFKERSFLEVETPLLVENPGTEPYLEVFKTTLKTQKYDDKAAFLVTSPELFMKKLLAAGIGNCFQIAKSFRNEEGRSAFHNHEFTILEWYRTEADYTDIMDDSEELLLFILKTVTKNPQATVLPFQGKEYDLSGPWERISVAEAFQKYAAISVETLLDEVELLKKAKSKGYAVTATTTWEEIYNQIFLNEIEPNLGSKKPTIIYDYPISQAALSKPKKSDPRFAERFEFYLAGSELGNAFSELTDPQVQRARMVEDLKLRKELAKYEFQLDEDFFKALEMGLPETGGIAVGVDRLVMLFADVPNVKSTLFFPIDEVFSFE